MRHFIGFVLAVVLAAAVFFGAAWGYLRLLQIPAGGGAVAALPAGGGSLLHDTHVLLAFAALAGTALLAGICVAAPRISPLASGLPGLGLLAWSVLYLVRVRRAVAYIPLKHDTFGVGFEAMLFNGVLAAAGFVLVVPLFIPSRWRRRVPWGGEQLDAVAAVPASTLISSDWAETAPIPQPLQPLPPLPSGPTQTMPQQPPDDTWS